MEDFSFFSKNLKTFLFANEITREELAQRLGVKAPSTVGKWINENRVPPGPITRMLEDMAGITMDEFINKDLTLKIIRDSKYTDLLAEPEDNSYTENAKMKMTLKHLEGVQEKLKSMFEEGERVLTAVK